jgi:hypothetical protein
MHHFFGRLRKHASVSLSFFHPPLFSSFSISRFLPTPALLMYSVYLILQNNRGAKTRGLLVEFQRRKKRQQYYKNVARTKIINKIIHPLKSSCYRTVRQNLIICPRSLFICFLLLSKQTSIFIHTAFTEWSSG